VRDVLKEAALGGEEGLKAIGHLIERPGEVAHFVAPLGVGARSEITITECDDRFAKLKQGANQADREQPGKESHDHQNSGEVGNGIDGLPGTLCGDADEHSVLAVFGRNLGVEASSRAALEPEQRRRRRLLHGRDRVDCRGEVSPVNRSLPARSRRWRWGWRVTRNVVQEVFEAILAVGFKGRYCLIEEEPVEIEAVPLAGAVSGPLRARDHDAFGNGV